MTVIAAIHPEQLQREKRRQCAARSELWQLLDQVKDPEIPVLSIWDLGVLQDIVVDDAGHITVIITPTYSGCPAMQQITQDVERALLDAGHQSITVQSQLSPAWTTDWMTANGREQLRRYGIAPPGSRQGSKDIKCPQCTSSDVKLISEFGSTACKALYQCRDCAEPFDYFKCI